MAASLRSDAARQRPPGRPGLQHTLIRPPSDATPPRYCRFSALPPYCGPRVAGIGSTLRASVVDSHRSSQLFMNREAGNEQPRPKCSLTHCRLARSSGGCRGHAAIGQPPADVAACLRRRRCNRARIVRRRRCNRRCDETREGLKQEEDFAVENLREKATVQERCLAQRLVPLSFQADVVREACCYHFHLVVIVLLVLLLLSLLLSIGIIIIITIIIIIGIVILSLLSSSK